MLTINYSFEPGVTLNQVVAFEMAARIWSEYIQDEITLDIHVGLTDQLAPNVLGGAIPAFQTHAVSDVKAALGRDITSPNDQRAVSSLGKDRSFNAVLSSGQYQGDTVTLTQAQAKALGLESALPSGSLDGVIVLNNLGDGGLQWGYDLQRVQAVNPQSIDLLSVAMHEVGHILGFISGVDASGQPSIQAQLDRVTILDWYRYSSQSVEVGANELRRGQQAYFSIDGGDHRDCTVIHWDSFGRSSSLFRTTICGYC